MSVHPDQMAKKLVLMCVLQSQPMADIRPFRAWRFDPGKVPVERVVTQPYDKITPAMRESYLASHPNNLVRILRPLDGTEPGEGESPYSVAARTWRRWQQEGIVVQVTREAIFGYYQRFRIPGAGELRTRKGFITLTHLEDYGRGVIFPHERTLSGPRQDRLELLRHTRTHFGQVFMLFSDPTMGVESILDDTISEEAPLTIVDEHAVEHQLWTITRKETIRDIQEQMSQRKLIIADGHHRYETALAFRDEERQRLGGGDAGPFEWLMTTHVNMDSPDMIVLPTHRVLSGLPGFDPAELLSRIETYYEVHDVPDPRLFAEVLAERGRSGHALGVVFGREGMKLLVLREAVDPAHLLSDLSPSEAALDVVLLHRLILERCLGLTEEAIRGEMHLGYQRDPALAIAEVREGRAQAAFILNPTPLGDVRDIAFQGGVLPQKSTDFYPKLLSGLIMYSVR